MWSFFQIALAYEFAAFKHSKQRRKNKDNSPYINHPIEVARIVVEAAEDSGKFDRGHIENMLVAALLHDTIEDAGVTAEEIAEKFGTPVMNMVVACTDDKTLPKLTRKQEQIKNAETISESAAYIKLADKFSNVKNVLEDPPLSWSVDEIRGYMFWSFHIIRILLNRFPNQYFSNLFIGLTSDLFGSSIDKELDAYYELLRSKESLEQKMPEK